MQHGCMQINSGKRGPDVWQFRWSGTGHDGMRLHHKKVVGTVEQYADENAARTAVVGLVSEIDGVTQPMNSRTITVAQLCDHFEQRELVKENTWRSHATKKIYKAYLSRWVRPHWQGYQLGEVRIIQVEAWLRTLPLSNTPLFACSLRSRLSQVLPFELFVQIDRSSRKHEHSIAAIVEGLRILRGSHHVRLHHFPDKDAVL